MNMSKPGEISLATDRSNTIRKTIRDAGLENTSTFQTNDKPIETEKLPHDEFNISKNSFTTDKMAKALELHHYREGEGTNGLEISFPDGPQRIKKEYDPAAVASNVRENVSDKLMAEIAINQGIEEATGRRVPPVNLTIGNSSKVEAKVKEAQSSGFNNFA